MNAMKWLLRREFWENKGGFFWAPVISAGVFLLLNVLAIAVAYAAAGRAHIQIGLIKLEPVLKTMDPQILKETVAGIDLTVMFLAAMIGVVSSIVVFFYSLGALYDERRDRSILFWKSLPVSDLTTVLAKAIIPLAVLPLIAFVLSLAVLAVLLLPVTAILIANGVSPGPLWLEVLLEQPPIMFYGLAAHALWFAPIYGWLLLVSVWARRAPFLWALSPLVLAMVEGAALQTSYVCGLLKYRVMGGMAEAFVAGPPSRGDVTRVAELDPLGFLASPGLWTGLIAAAFFLATAVRLRRYREPI